MPGVTEGNSNLLEANLNSSNSSKSPLEIAQTELTNWNAATDAEKLNMVNKYLASCPGLSPNTSIWGPTFWCAAFVNWCVTTSGMTGPSSPQNVSSWASWTGGTVVSTPTPGCLALGSDATGYLHIGFYTGGGYDTGYKGAWEENVYWVLGGDQDGGLSNIRYETNYYNFTFIKPKGW